MSNIKTTLGGALSILGTTLIGMGLVPQVGGVPNKVLTYVAITGFVLSALGKFFAALFAADASSVKDLQQQINTTNETKQDK